MYRLRRNPSSDSTPLEWLVAWTSDKGADYLDSCRTAECLLLSSMLQITSMASIASMSSPRGKALSKLSAGHFHQCLWLPQTTDHPRLRVTYATTGNFSDESLPVILFIGPMFGSRYLILEIDKLARDSGVRVVVPDRYGLT